MAGVRRNMMAAVLIQRRQAATTFVPVAGTRPRHRRLGSAGHGPHLGPVAHGGTDWSEGDPPDISGDPAVWGSGSLAFTVLSTRMTPGTSTTMPWISVTSDGNDAVPVSVTTPSSTANLTSP